MGKGDDLLDFYTLYVVTSLICNASDLLPLE